ncbi:hypothetical protein FQN52_005809 [Onygenales sp. PD_12]|nr:hypothetical protein FQN52_005809 [Onygenales sp. PD_12]
MQFTDEQSKEVKGWVVKKLEDIADADSEVLADYVLALICSDAPDEDIRKASVEGLEDFLKENTTGFVDEIFAKYGPKPQPPVQAPEPPPQRQQQQQLPAIPVAPQAMSGGFPQQPQQQPVSPPKMTPFGHGQTPMMGAGPPPARPGFDMGGANYSRKRAFNEGPQASEGPDSHYNHGDRPFKSLRGHRGSRGGRLDRMVGRDGRMPPGAPAHAHPNQPDAFQRMPPVPPAGFPPFNPNDPVATMMALQAMGFPQMPGMPPLPQVPTGAGPNGQNQPGSPPARIPQRCRDYDTQGFCVLGSTCPYQHGTDHLVAPARDDEYDPAKSNIVMDRSISANASNGHSPAGPSRGGDRGRGRGRGRGDRGAFNGRGRNRADFSQAGPNEDRSITTIVVEQIPEDKFDEKIVRDFFSEFGTVTDVTMQPYKHLALVKYDTWAAARRAWSSPKVIFDNRFVKVYWYKPGAKTETNGAHPPSTSQSPTRAKPDEKMFDQEEFEKQQAEAQRQHEEKMKKRKETEEARLALEKQREDLLKRQQEEKEKLMQRLGVQGATTTNGQNGTSPHPAGSESEKPATPADENASEQTKSLRAQLAALEAEAKSLGLDPALSSDGSSQYPPRGRGRGWGGGYRGGRGAFPPRGRGGYDPSFRGGYRGRGGAPRGRGGVLRLDNRPKRVAVSGVEFNPDKDEALRQFLIGMGEYENIEPNPDRADSQIVSFKDRYMAEQLMYGPTEIPSVGKVEYSWVANAAAAPSSSSTTAPATRDNSVSALPAKKEDEDAVMSMGVGVSVGHEADSIMRKEAAHEVDYDVAEMEDAWAVE